jgi:predicted nucleic acid-binding protein
MRILIDNNVVIDALARRDIYQGSAEQIFSLAAEDKFALYITANSATDIYYVYRRLTSAGEAETALRYIFSLMKIVTISGEDCRKALESPVSDFEDALIVLCAEKIKADYLVTRDEELLSEQYYPDTIHPGDFVSKFEKLNPDTMLHEDLA